MRRRRQARTPPAAQRAAAICAVVFAAAGAAGACRPGAPAGPAGAPPVPGGMQAGTLANRFAYIPPQCYTMTREAPGGAVHNPCYACHMKSVAPNFVDDADLQKEFSIPGAAATNAWRNLFDPPVARAHRVADADLLAYVRTSNYFDAGGRIALARTLGALPAAWDGQGDRRWDGYTPDAWFRFDARGFDHAPDGRATGWRAFAYTPFLGTFFPTNGSMDDVLIRLDPALREDAAGHPDQAVYELNLAIVEALIRRADVAIDPIDETRFGADVDLDGVIGRASRVAFRAPPAGASRAPAMHYVGRARAQQDAGTLPLEPGLMPLGTEMLHSVRYLDVGADGEVTMAARMKELRYAKKVRWLGPADLRAKAAADTVEQNESADGWRQFLWQFDRGIYNGQGWLLQGFIEAADGSLRPQSYEESVPCVGCHGEIGATTDSLFAFARKLGKPGSDAPARGWFHWSQHDLRGIAEPRRRDGRYEYTLYLTANGAGDELRENGEVVARFFDQRGAPRDDAFRRLHGDIATLLLPSAARALDLDRAYLAIVREQSFAAGRDAVLAPSRHVHRRLSAGEKTGVDVPLAGPNSDPPRSEPGAGGARAARAAVERL
jgi:hypothetical protein